jgi:tetrahydromethanopterin:alpha-L-glutamate ligase
VPGRPEPLRIGVVGVRKRWSTQQLCAAVEARTGRAWLIELERVALDLASGQVRCGDLDLGTLDALIIKKLGDRYAPELLDRLQVLRFLDEHGTPVFSRPRAIEPLLDRLSCTVALRLAGIPMPETVITEDVDEAVAAVRRFGEAVLKPLFTSKARGMRLVCSDGRLRESVEAFRAAGNQVLYVQRRVELPGRDLGVVFLGGEYLACYARVAHQASWHTSTSKGGGYQACDPGPEVIALARRAQAPFGLDFTSVDVVESRAGPLVFEVSAFGGFRGLLEAAGINAAERLTDYVLGKLGHG